VGATERDGSTVDEKLIARIRKLLGDDSDVTDAQIETAFKGTKFYDVNDGGYISQEKVDRLVATQKDRADKAEGELTDLKAATDGDDGLKKQVATLTEENGQLKTKLGETSGELTKAQRTALVNEKLSHLSPKLRRLAMQDAGELVTDSLDFAGALEKVVADDPDYADPDAGDDDEEDAEVIVTGKVSTGKAPKGKTTEGGDDKAFDAFEAGALGESADDKDKKKE
jgi:hypothetical protein